MTVRARYDGIADWYDENVAWSTAAATPLLMCLVGAGRGRCLDVGCGTGVHLVSLADAGWSVVGVDASADQLRVARQRARAQMAAIIQGDVGRLPFAGDAFDLVVSAFTHTDVDDFARLAAEVRRVLRPHGRFVYVGLHPCFTGVSAEQPREDGARVIHPEYRQAGWRTSGPGSVSGGLASRVGFRHLPLANLLNNMLEAGLRLEHVEEGGNRQLPEWLAFVARR
jgi:ubiquinone/menaquinone biosynthesis C-methylase UbiE